MWDYQDTFNEDNKFYVAELAFFIFAVGLLGAALIWHQSRIMGLIAAFSSLGYLKTYLLAHAPKSYFFESTIIAFGFFVLYHTLRAKDVRQDVLKYFLIPAVLNIILILTQAFDHHYMPFMPTNGVSGFLGNKSVSALYIGICAPLFIKYFKWGIPFMVAAILVCNAGVAFLAMVGSSLVYLWHTRRDNIMFHGFVCTLVVASICYLPFVVKHKTTILGEAQGRISMWLGTLDGIKRNPIFGWGVGSFIPVISKIKPEDSVYFGVPFNGKQSNTVVIMNHPHNELLAGWWRIGIAFPVLCIAYLVQLVRQFKEVNVLSFSILVGCVIAGMGWFFTLPVCFLFVTALTTYENHGG